MSQTTSRKISLVIWFLFAASILPGRLAAQNSSPSRISRAVDEHRLVVLKSTRHPLAKPEFERSTAPDSLPAERVLLFLQRSAEQEAALATLLEDQLDPASSNYHRWLTPDEFGQRFGAAQTDIEAISTWLRSHGFRVEPVTGGRQVIEFSGTAGQIREAFHTSIRKYVVNGEEHWANDADPQIPEALSGVVAGIASLHNFHARPQHRPVPGWISRAGAQPATSFGGGSVALGPGDYATIYNIAPVYQSGINGAGATIGVVGRTNINVQDVIDFRRVFALASNAPQIIVNGTNPGNLGGGEELEAVLDVSWSGATAPGATVKFVISQSTNTSDGIILSEQYIINNNLADVMTESFGACEATTNASTANFLSSLRQQAAAQGITFMVSSGDSGAEGCSDPTSSTASGGISVNVLASTPYSLAVGGTMFNEAGNPSAYWSASNASGLSSALKHIPESVWNESGGNLYAGGGGVSVFFSRPGWQSGVPGIPSGSMRYIPDVSLTAAGHDPYLVCLHGSCSGSSISFSGVGGTSASTPAFAGIMALVKQKAGARQGQANSVLYRIAGSQTYSQCDGSSASTTEASNCVFHDVTVGNNAVPGESGYGTPSGQYQATLGFDGATGLGSVNVNNLINNWNGPAPTLQATLTPTSLGFGTLNVGSASAAQLATLTNTGGGAVTITSISITGTNPGDFSQTNTCGASLPIGASCTVSVTFKPAASGTRTATLTITDNAGSSPQTVSLSGSGQSVSSPTVSFSSTNVVFSNTNVGSSNNLGDAMSNTGSSTVVVSSVTITGTNAADFTQSNNCVGVQIAPGSYCLFSITFRPPAAGTRTAVMTVTDSAVGSPHIINLSGTGVVPAGSVSINPGSLTFASQPLGVTSIAQGVTLSNTGATAVNISSIALAGSNPGDFAQSNNCPASLAPNTSCSFTVTFRPAAAGNRTATLLITDDATGSPQSVSLSGTGTSAAGSVSLSPGSLTFGSQNVGTSSAAQPVTLSNTGSIAVNISSIARTGANAGDFAQTNNCPSSLAPGSSCTISVTFQPSASGTRTASLAVSDDASGSPQTVSLSGTGGGTSAGPSAQTSLSRTSLTFFGRSAQPVTLTNTGTAALTISSVGVSGTNAPDFKVTSACAATVAPGASCTITITFAPGAGTSFVRSAMARITDNAPGSPQSVSLVGYSF